MHLTKCLYRNNNNINSNNSSNTYLPVSILEALFQVNLGLPARTDSDLAVGDRSYKDAAADGGGTSRASGHAPSIIYKKIYLNWSTSIELGIVVVCRRATRNAPFTVTTPTTRVLSTWHLRLSGEWCL